MMVFIALMLALLLFCCALIVFMLFCIGENVNCVFRLCARILAKLEEKK